MTEKRRFLDVWIIEGNTVYKEVPFDVVSDWVQQGRLLEDDMVKPSGTREWFRLGASRDLAAYLPRAEPHRPADRAEALEAVELDFRYKKPHDEEDDDVDMIPLIDVSLVLLIFFMLTASSVVASAGFVNTPETENGSLVDHPGSIRIDISRDTDDSPVYALGVADRQAARDDSDLRSQAAVLDRLKARLARADGPVELIINADKDLEARVARDLLLALRAEPFRSKISVNFFGVSEKEP
jgi:biopolymer transport protein ExbD